MVFGNRLYQYSCAVRRIDGRQSQLKCERMIEEGIFYDQAIGGAMKATFIQLIGLSIFQRQVRIAVMGYQRVNSQLWRDTKRKQRQKNACEYGPYDAIASQDSLKQSCKLAYSF